MIIGIPRALFYYYYSPLWKTFFEELGLEVIFSPPTSKDIIQRGVGLAVDEACLPVKTFYGHVDLLKKQVDILFLPRLISVAPKEYICPKFMGLPDMIKQKILDLPEILDPVIDCSKSANQMEKTFLSLGESISTQRLLIKNAWQRAMANYLNFQKKVKSGHKYFQALTEESLKSTSKQTNAKAGLQVGLIGHGYNIYDYSISMGLIERLEKLGANVITAENLPDNLINLQAMTLPKPMFWTLGKRALGAAMHWVNQGGIDGIIYFSAFGCGPDSLVGDLIERYCRKRNYPILHLTVDEHTGEAGMDTRIEAFIDLLERRKYHESNISTYGQSFSSC